MEKTVSFYDGNFFTISILKYPIIKLSFHRDPYNENDIQEYAISKLKEYYYQSLLYASDDVMRSFKLFLARPDRQNYIITAQKMRADLWNNKTTVTTGEI